MYEGKIVAEATIEMPLDVRTELSGNMPRGSMFLGAAVLLVGLPFLVVRVFTHLIVRDVRRIGTLARIVGSAAAEARR